MQIRDYMNEYEDEVLKSIEDEDDGNHNNTNGNTNPTQNYNTTENELLLDRTSSGLLSKDELRFELLQINNKDGVLNNKEIKMS